MEKTEITVSVSKWHPWLAVQGEPGFYIPPGIPLRVPDLERGGSKIVGARLADLEVSALGKTWRHAFAFGLLDPQTPEGPSPLAVVCNPLDDSTEVPEVLKSFEALKTIRDAVCRLAQTIPGGYHAAAGVKPAPEGKPTKPGPAKAPTSGTAPTFPPAAAAIRPTTPPAPVPPAVTFEGLVDELVKAGSPRGAAVTRVVSERPDLHEQFLARINPGATLARPAERMAPPIPAGMTFEGEVEKLVKAGRKRSDAIAAVVSSHPDLHQQYLERINSR
ncbi:MAG: hypothetical protein GX442_24255 [Candidatus Riflebacteria bacterium]|nr:hypothetical protein [Candidatus Riflebacteria bacterium]